MYEKHRQQLDELKDELQIRIAKAQASLSCQRNSNWTEQATERENDEVLNELVREANEELQQIKKALTAMDSRMYGQCTACGEKIDPKRLSVMPMSTLCIRCAKQA